MKRKWIHANKSGKFQLDITQVTAYWYRELILSKLYGYYVL